MSADRIIEHTGGRTRSMFRQQAWALLAVFALTGIVFAALGWFVARTHVDVTSQQLNRDLAERIVKENTLTYVDGQMVNTQAIKKTFDHYMTVNPAIEIYQLDVDGNIIAFSADPGVVKRDAIDLEPVKAMIGNTQALPILGDDPRGEGRRKIFSASALSKDNDELGYLYVILRGQAVDVIESAFGDSYLFKALATALAASLALGLIASLIIFRLLGRRLENLASRMTALGSNLGASGPTEQRLASEQHALTAPRTTDEVYALESTFDAMAGRIEHQMAELSDKDAKRREFLAHISHDLRTPLTVVNTALESLAVRFDRLDDAQRLDHIKTARHESERLTGLVNDLFQLARLDNNTDTNAMEPVAVGDLIQDVAHKHHLSCHSADVTLEALAAGNLPMVHGNVGLIERMLDNIVTNAIAHTPANGRIEIAAKHEDGVVRVSVTDTGPGIAPADRSRIFDPGYRGARRTGNGAGLGLAISRKIAQWHEGELRLTDSPTGARFEFTLHPVEA